MSLFLLLFQFCLWSSGELLPLLPLGHHLRLLDYLRTLTFDVQQSVAHLTVVGCAVAAVISGFATVSFPLQQLMILRGVNPDLLRDRRLALQRCYHDICELKKTDLRRRRRTSSNASLPMLNLSSDRAGSWLAQGLGECVRHCSMWLGNQPKRKSSFDGSNDCNGLQDTSLSSAFLASPAMLIRSRERETESLFLELVQLNELAEEAVTSRTMWGRGLRLAGYLFSAVGFFRVYVGAIHIVEHVLGQSSLASYGESEGEDTVTAVLRLMSTRWGLPIDQLLWPPALSFLMVGALSLMQVRAFLTSAQDFARLGFLSRNTELYSLLLSHLAGVYFVACVVLLRIQLPPRRRLAVTAALGKDIQFSFFLLWFDFFFVMSAILFGIAILLHHIRRHRYSMT